MASLFGPDKHGTDLAYNNINETPSGLSDLMKKLDSDIRDFVDSLWLRFKPYADKHFETEIRNNFQARTWEMYLGCSLLDCGLRLFSSDSGPDFKVEVEEKIVWFEAVIATSGEPEKPDTVPDFTQRNIAPEEIVAHKLPLDKIILRLRSVIEDKHKKYVEYCEKSIVGPNDPYVIAINGWNIRFSKNDGITPTILQAVFPLGDLLVPITTDPNDTAEPFYKFRSEIQKHGGALVSTDVFLDEQYRGISAVVYSAADAANGPYTLGSDYVIVHNPIAKNPLTRGMIKLGREYVLVATEDGYSLDTVVSSEANSS